MTDGYERLLMTFKLVSEGLQCDCTCREHGGGAWGEGERERKREKITANELIHQNHSQVHDLFRPEEGREGHLDGGNSSD